MHLNFAFWQCAQDHKDYSRVQLFPHSLADCKFEEQHVFTQPAATLQFMTGVAAGGGSGSGDSVGVAGLLPPGMVRDTRGIDR